MWYLNKLPRPPKGTYWSVLTYPDCVVLRLYTERWPMDSRIIKRRNKYVPVAQVTQRMLRKEAWRILAWNWQHPAILKAYGLSRKDFQIQVIFRLMF